MDCYIVYLVMISNNVTLLLSIKLYTSTFYLGDFGQLSPSPMKQSWWTCFLQWQTFLFSFFEKVKSQIWHFLNKVPPEDFFSSLMLERLGYAESACARLLCVREPSSSVVLSL